MFESVLNSFSSEKLNKLQYSKGSNYIKIHTYKQEKFKHVQPLPQTSPLL